MGMGFANVLSEIGIANEQLVMSLLFFNLGIEAGQLLLIPLFSLFLWIAYRIRLNRQSVSYTHLTLPTNSGV